MTKTIAGLLQEHDIVHNISRNSPILFIPIVLFNQEEQYDLMAILWLDGQGLINEKIVRQPYKEMGEVSKEEVFSYFESIKEYLKSNQSIVKPDKPKWVNITLISQFIATKSAYKIFNSIAQRFVNYFLRFLEDNPAIEDAPVFSEYTQVLNTSNIRAQNITVIANTFTEVELFKDESDPLYFIHRLIIKINKRIPDKLYTKEVLNYFRDILIELSKRYTPTLDALLIRFDASLLHELSDLNNDLTAVLDMELTDLTQDEQPILIFYTLLFVSKAAREDPNYNFSYAGNELPAALNKIALEYAELFKDFAAKPELWGEALKKNLFSGLNRRMDSSFPGIDPKLLALICFKNYPRLKKLFSSLREDGTAENSNGQTIAVLPLKNRFLLGKTYRMRDQQHPISISNDDIIILEQLKGLADQFKKAKARDGSIKMFSSAPTSTYTADFLNLKMKIKNTTLRDSLSIASIDNFVPCMIINSEPLLDFFENNIRNLDSPEPPYEHLKDFFKIHTELAAIDPLIKQAKLDEMFEWLDNPQGLNEVIKTFKNIINTLNKKLKTLNFGTPTDEIKLQIRWAEVQKYVQISLLMTAQEKLTQLKVDLAELEIVRGASNCFESGM